MEGLRPFSLWLALLPCFLSPGAYSSLQSLLFEIILFVFFVMFILCLTCSHGAYILEDEKEL